MRKLFQTGYGNKMEILIMLLIALEICCFAIIFVGSLVICWGIMLIRFYKLVTKPFKKRRLQ